MKATENKLTPVQWFASKSEDLRGKLTLGAISPKSSIRNGTT